MARFRARYFVQNDLQTAGDVLLDIAAEKRELQAQSFHDEMVAYLAETDELRAAGRPLSERKLKPPISTPYEITATDEVGSVLKGFGGFLTKLVILMLGGVGLLFILVVMSWPG